MSAQRCLTAWKSRFGFELHPLLGVGDRHLQAPVGGTRVLGAVAVAPRSSSWTAASAADLLGTG